MQTTQMERRGRGVIVKKKGIKINNSRWQRGQEGEDKEMWEDERMKDKNGKEVRQKTSIKKNVV